MEHPIIISSKGRLRKFKLDSFIQRLIEKARQQIMAQEDDLIFKALDDAEINVIT